MGLWLLGRGAEQKKGEEKGGWSGTVEVETGMSVGMDEHVEIGPTEETKQSEMQEREVERGRGRGGGGVEEKHKREVERGRRGRGKRGYRGASNMGCRISTQAWWVV